MRGMRWLVVVMFACSHPAPTEPPGPPVDASAAVKALREARFGDAEAEAATVLARDPHSAQGAAVRAVAAYQQAGSTLVTEIEGQLAFGDGMKFFDHEGARKAWRAFGDQLEAVDNDLAVAAADPKFALELCLACWEHDWNRNGRIDDRDRKLFEIEYDGKGGELPDGDPRRRPTFRFDVGDVLWARAMVSFQRAGVELVLAYRWSELDKVFTRGDKPIIIH